MDVLEAIFFIVTIVLKTHGNVCDYDTNLQVNLQQEDNKILECHFEKHCTLNISAQHCEQFHLSL
jgi:hypothetical protein